MESVPDKNYDVFRLTSPDGNSPTHSYVARKHFVERMDEVEELHSMNASGLGKCLVNYHLKYLKNHPSIDDNSLLNHVSCFNVNINYNPPYHIKLNQNKAFEVKEFTTTEKKEFLQSLQSRLTEYWESDEVI